MSNVVPAFPNALFTWTDRVDQVNIDFANDINSVASDLISVENTLGTNPQTEKNPPNAKKKIKYSTVDARISDAMANAQLPAVILRSNSFVVNNTSAGDLTNFNKSYDPFGMYNGTDLTIVQDGWYYFTVHQTWQWWNDGYSHTMLTTNGNIVDEDVINWEFAGNKTGANADIPRWQKFGLRSIIAHVNWQGRCAQGERISVLAENGTSNTKMQVTYTSLKASMVKTLPPSDVSDISITNE